MNKLTLNSKILCIISIFLLYIFDMAIVLDIPLLRQISGFVILLFIPGVLIINIIGINKIGFIEKIVLYIGISVSLIFFVGLLLNTLAVNFGYFTPLSLTPLLISFNLMIISLAISGYLFNKKSIDFEFQLNLSTFEKSSLVIPFLFPVLSIYGVTLLKTTGNSAIIITFLIAILIYLIFMCIFNYKLVKIYSYVIYLISLSLLLLYAFRSNYVIGIDSHLEYYFFQNTLNNMYWSILENSILDSSLSISLLPAIFSILLNISSDFLFKILYVLIYSFSPLIIYVIAKKYVDDYYAFLTSCFFMFQHSFLTVAMNARTSLAIFFFSLVVMVLFNDNISQIQKRILLIIFMFSIILSHYSTAYILFFLLCAIFIFELLLSYMLPIKSSIKVVTILLYVTFVFLWYSLITVQPFNSGVHFVWNTLLNLNQMFMLDSRGGGVPALLGEGIKHKVIADQIQFFSTWLTFIFIGIGLITLIVRYKEMSFPELNYSKSNLLKTKFESSYFAFALLCAGLLFVMIAVPFISKGYGIQRLYAMTLVILSIFFVLGVYSFSKAIHIKSYLIFFLIVIPYFLSVSGVTYNVLGMESTALLDSQGPQYSMYYISDQESFGAKWLKDYGENNKRVFADYYGRFRLISQGNYPPKTIDWYSLGLQKNNNGYIYLRTYNVINNKFVERNEISRIVNYNNLSDYDSFFVNKNLVYNNNATEIYV